MLDHLELQMDTYLPLRDVVFHTLRAAIMRGDLKPGERLMELQLAAKLGVSRTPIREAIRMLEQEGLAITIPRKGAEVARMTEKDMEDVLQIRVTLEELAGRVACEKITPEELHQLEAAMKDFDEKTKTGDLIEIAKADEIFHDIIYKAADNAQLMYLVGKLREKMYRYRVEYLKDESTYVTLVKEHKEIFYGLQNNDVEYVCTMIRQHLANQEITMKNIIRRQG